MTCSYPLERGFLGSQEVSDCAVCQTNSDMYSRYSPRKRKVVEDRLVLQVETNIERIPVVAVLHENERLSATHMHLAA